MHPICSDLNQSLHIELELQQKPGSKDPGFFFTASFSLSFSLGLTEALGGGKYEEATGHNLEQ